ncbi:MAG: pentapeptide repeat-containing protein [Anaerolineales bacterium]|nr:pentapeptide repeat-containing protein [Anaerolineales bacterium]
MSTEIVSQTQYYDQVFQDLHLEAVMLDSSEFRDCTFHRCLFSNSEFVNCKFIACTFRECDLSLLQVPGSSFISILFEESKAVGINWALANWSTAKLGSPIQFKDCSINHSTFIGVTIRGVKIVDCIATEVDFRDSDLTRADFSGTDLSSSLFTSTNLTEADFSKARNYHIAPNQNTLKNAKFSLPEAMSLLYSLEIILVDDEV